MKILIIVPREKNNLEKNYNTLFPLGVGYICSSLKKKGYFYDVINLNHSSGYICEVLSEQIGDQQYDLICIGDSLKGFHTVKIIIEHAKVLIPQSVIVLGGLILNYKPEIIFEKLRPTIGVIGEGDDTIIEIAEFCGGKRDLKSITGIVYSDIHGNIVKSLPREKLVNLDELPFPDFESLGITKTFGRIHTNSSHLFYCKDVIRAYPILGSRSCPYHCTFCGHLGGYRQRSLDNIKEELDLVVSKYQINMINVYDEMMGSSRIREFANYMILLGESVEHDIHWTCVLRVDVVDSEILALLKRSGCVAICYGFESYDQRILDSMKKMTSPKQIKYALSETLKQKIAVFGHFIFGDIAETESSIARTVDFWKKYPGQINLHFLKPYPNSVIYNYAMNKGIIKDEWQYLTYDMFREQMLVNITSFSKRKYRKAMRQLMCLQRKYTPFAVAGNVSRNSNKTYLMKVTCPNCKEKIEYDGCELKVRIPMISIKTFKTRCRHCSYLIYVGGILEKIVFKSFLSKLLSWNVRVHSL